jgi:hypothetical protein
MVACQSVDHFPRLRLKKGSRLSRIGKLAFRETGLVEIIVPASVEVLSEYCFCLCRSLSSVTFEIGSRLPRIEAEAFCQTGLDEIIIPASVELLCERCFSLCTSLSSVRFETGSKLSRIEK